MTDTSAIFFHATCRELLLGDTLVADANTSYYPEVVSLLELARPEGYPSRSKCVFAADSAAAAYRFLMSQPEVNASDIKIYRVQMDIFRKAPFRLIHELSKRLKNSGSTENLVEEYWNPAHDWVFWEYFGPSFKVLEQMETPNPVEAFAFGLKYERDSEFSRSL